MAKLVERANIEVQATLTLSEAELRALEELSQFAAKDVVDLFSENLSSAFGSKHRPALEGFLASFRQFAPDILKKVEAARKAFNK